MEGAIASDDTVSAEYMRSVAGTRRVMSNVLNIIAQQERTMRTVIANEQRRRSINHVNEQRRHSINHVNEQRRHDDFVTLFTHAIASPASTAHSLAPSSADINHATREVLFSTLENPINNVCPISRENFTEDQTVIQIIHCGHIFSRDDLRTWLLSSAHCPMCRYDIRNYRTRINAVRERRRQSAPSSNNVTETNMNNQSVSSTQAMDQITNLISNDILHQIGSNNYDGSNNLLFEYTIPTPDNSSSHANNTDQR